MKHHYLRMKTKRFVVYTASSRSDTTDSSTASCTLVAFSKAEYNTKDAGSYGLDKIQRSAICKS